MKRIGDRLYREYWKHFENPYWEDEVRVGRSRITLSELFFQHFLIAKLGKESVTPLFNVYQRNLTRKQNVKYELSELKKVFRSLSKTDRLFSRF